jgi:hypothetical protein
MPAKTWGAGSAFTWTFDGGANTDPNLLFTSGATPSITTNSVVLAPAGTASNVAFGLSTQPQLWNPLSPRKGRGVGRCRHGHRQRQPGQRLLRGAGWNGSWHSIAGGADVKWTRCGAGMHPIWRDGPQRRARRADAQVQNAITGTDLAAASQFRVIGRSAPAPALAERSSSPVGGKQATGTTAHAKG